MIAWLAVSSETMAAADASRGFARRETWDLLNLIYKWGDTLPEKVIDFGADDDVFQTFGDAMTRAGHTCHDVPYDRLLFKRWTYMRSLLNPEQRYDIVYLSLSTTSKCEPCAARYLQV
jgi:hypothetical protein